MEHSLSRIEGLILDLLSEDAEMYGLELVEAAEGRLRNFNLFKIIG
jgi:hypothetical protein